MPPLAHIPELHAERMRLGAEALARELSDAAFAVAAAANSAAPAVMVTAAEANAARMEFTCGLPPHGARPDPARVAALGEVPLAQTPAVSAALDALAAAIVAPGAIAGAAAGADGAPPRAARAAKAALRVLSALTYWSPGRAASLALHPSVLPAVVTALKRVCKAGARAAAAGAARPEVGRLFAFARDLLGELALARAAAPADAGGGAGGADEGRAAAVAVWTDRAALDRLLALAGALAAAFKPAATMEARLRQQRGGGGGEPGGPSQAELECDCAAALAAALLACPDAATLRRLLLTAPGGLLGALPDAIDEGSGWLSQELPEDPDAVLAIAAAVVARPYGPGCGALLLTAALAGGSVVPFRSSSGRVAFTLAPAAEALAGSDAGAAGAGNGSRSGSGHSSGSNSGTAGARALLERAPADIVDAVCGALCCDAAPSARSALAALGAGDGGARKATAQELVLFAAHCFGHLGWAAAALVAIGPHRFVADFIAEYPDLMEALVMLAHATVRLGVAYHLEPGSLGAASDAAVVNAPALTARGELFARAARAGAEAIFAEGVRQGAGGGPALAGVMMVGGGLRAFEGAGNTLCVEELLQPPSRTHARQRRGGGGGRSSGGGGGGGGGGAEERARLQVMHERVKAQMAAIETMMHTKDRPSAATGFRLGGAQTAARPAAAPRSAAAGSGSGGARQPAAAGAGACQACGAAGAALTCSGCRAVSYCSRDCQRAAWPAHKAACKSAAAAIEAAAAAVAAMAAPPAAGSSAVAASSSHAESESAVAAAMAAVSLDEAPAAAPSNGSGAGAAAAAPAAAAAAAPAPAAAAECGACGAPGASLRCGGCGTARYCGATCQKKAWAAHKAACKQAQQQQQQQQQSAE